MVTILAALGLVLVPTLFSIFPEWQTWSLVVRIPVSIAWAVVAWFTATSAARQSRNIEKLVGEPLSRRAKRREAAAAHLIRSLLLPGSTGFPAHYQFRLFLPDEEQQRLLPIFESEGVDPSEGWGYGQGAVGLAWDADNCTLVDGPAVSDATHGLSPAQQARYKDLAIVSAMPIRDERNRQVAVLSVSSKTDDGFLRTEEAFLTHLELAEVVSRILIDILGRQD